jgi:ubiquinone/menaquinone biosynthesis C-methylase UbiE
MSEYDPASYMEKLYLSNPLQDPLVRRVVRELGLAEGSLGLDAGCGVGLQLPTLIEAVGPSGRVVGLDIRAEFIEEAARNVAAWGAGGRVSLVRGDIYDLPFQDQEFDWIWSASCACYSMSRPLELLGGFRRVLKPEGRLFILIWSAQQLLPGYPLLEAHLNATTAGIAPFTRRQSPEHHFLRLLGWMDRAGLVDPCARSFTQDVCAPLDDPQRQALLTLMRMRWLEGVKELRRAERRLFQRITDPSSPEFILSLPDYCGFYTYTLFQAACPRCAKINSNCAMEKSSRQRNFHQGGRDVQ